MDTSNTPSRKRKNGKYGKTKVSANKEYFRKRITLPNGKQKSIYASTQGELDRKLAAFRRELTANPLPAPNDVTVREYAERQLEIMKGRVQPQTFVGYKSAVHKYLIDRIGDKKITEVRPDDLNMILSSMSGLSASFVHQFLTLVKTIFSAAMQNGIITRDPSASLKVTGKAPVKKRSLSDKERDVLLAAVNGLGNTDTFVRIAIYTGLRREEILGLQWDCVHLDEAPYIEVKRTSRFEHNRPIIEENTKTAASRRNVGIPSVLADYLRSVKSASKSSFVIANSKNKPLSGSQWRNCWKKVQCRSTATRTVGRGDNKHQITPKRGDRSKNNPHVVYTIDFHVTPHILRHTYITNLIAKNVDPKTVQYLAGHKNSKMTMDVYADVKDNCPAITSKIVSNVFDEN